MLKHRLKSNSGWWRIEPDGTLRVYLNGSERLPDWVRNFQTCRRKVRGVRVNRVDRREALATIRELRGEIDRAERVIVGGHSRGASEASIMAFELGCESVLFAPKRTGCKRFVQSVDYIGFRHRGDFVPFLPPWNAGFKVQVFGPWRPVWISHEPREYQKRMEQYGF